MRLSRSIALPHPGDEQGKWARGLKAYGSEAIRKGWPKWSCPYAFRFSLHLLTSVDDGAAFDDDEEEDVHLRSGEGEMMEIDDEDYAMDLGSGIEDHNCLDMDREEDEDVEMDPQEIQTRKRTQSQLDMGYRAVKDEEGSLKRKTKQEGDVMDIVERWHPSRRCNNNQRFNNNQICLRHGSIGKASYQLFCLFDE